MDLSPEELALLRCLAKPALQRIRDANAALDLPAEKVPGHVLPRDCPRERLVSIGYVRELPQQGKRGRPIPGALLAKGADGRQVRLEITQAGIAAVNAALVEE